MLSFILVTCYRDLDLALRLLASVEEYFNRFDLKEFVVVWNEPQGFDQFKRTLERFDLPLVVVDWPDLSPSLTFWDWHSQQELKLRASNWCTGQFIVYHDSKDYYIKTADRGLYLTMNLQIKYSTCRQLEPYVSQYFNSYRLFGAEFGSYMLKHWTPNCVATREVQALVRYMDQHYGLVEWPYISSRLQGNGQLFTEFGLISGWLASRGILEKRYLEEYDFCIDDWVQQRRSLDFAEGQQDLTLADFPTLGLDTLAGQPGDVAGSVTVTDPPKTQG